MIRFNATVTHTDGTIVTSTRRIAPAMITEAYVKSWADYLLMPLCAGAPIPATVEISTGATIVLTATRKA